MSVEQFIALAIAAGGVVSFIWHAGMYVGKLTNRVSRLEDKVNEHERWLSKFTDAGV